MDVRQTPNHDPVGPSPSIYHAAHAGDIDAISRLLNQHPELINEPSKITSLTALHFARDAATVNALIRRGAQVDVRDSQGRTPLHRHRQYADLGVVAVLARSGADLRARDDIGMTPMFLAAASSNSEGESIVRLLLGYGVPLDLNSALVLGWDDAARKLLADDPDAVAGAPMPDWLLMNA